MPVLSTRLSPSDQAHAVNRAGMLERLAEIGRLLEEARQGGGEKYVVRHRARGKLLARERVERLLDRDAPFLELSPLAGWGSEYPIGGSVVSGIGPDVVPPPGPGSAPPPPGSAVGPSSPTKGTVAGSIWQLVPPSRIAPGVEPSRSFGISHGDSTMPWPTSP